MAEASHTPGPWKRGSCDSFIIWAKGYQSTEWAPGSRVDTGQPEDERVVIADVSAPAWADERHDPETRDKWLAESEANARLIASAPDLLASLREMLFLAKCYGPDRSPVSELKAIKRAEDLIALTARAS